MGRVLRAAENTRKHSAPDCMRRSCPGLKEDPGPLASGSLEFLGSSKAPDVGVPAEAGDGENVHGLSDARNQRHVHGRVQKDDEATRQSVLHS